MVAVAEAHSPNSGTGAEELLEADVQVHDRSPVTRAVSSMPGQPTHRHDATGPDPIVGAQPRDNSDPRHPEHLRLGRANQLDGVPDVHTDVGSRQAAERDLVVAGREPTLEQRRPSLPSYCLQARASEWSARRIAPRLPANNVSDFTSGSASSRAIRLSGSRLGAAVANGCIEVGAISEWLVHEANEADSERDGSDDTGEAQQDADHRSAHRSTIAGPAAEREPDSHTGRDASAPCSQSVDQRRGSDRPTLSTAHRQGDDRPHCEADHEEGYPGEHHAPLHTDSGSWLQGPHEAERELARAEHCQDGAEQRADQDRNARATAASARVWDRVKPMADRRSRSCWDGRTWRVSTWPSTAMAAIAATAVRIHSPRA